LNRRLLIAAAVLGALVVALFAAYRYALHRLQGALLDALGPRASVGAVEISWNRVEVRGLRIRAEREGRQRWPAEDELRAERVLLAPDLVGALSGQWRVGKIAVDKPYLSLYRSRDGKLHVLPALLERAAPAAQQAAQQTAAAPLVFIDRVQLRDAEVELYDASVRQPAHKLRLAALQADVRDLKLPTLDQPVAIAIEALFKGPQRDGRLQIDGTLTPATHDAKLKADVHGVDLVALEPYLLKVAEGGVKRGSLDLKLDATVQQNKLKAPGTLTLHQLELGKSGSFAGVPQRAVIAAMGRDGRIEVHFTLAGRLDDPNFSLNEDFATRITAALAERLGVSVGGVVEGVGSVIKGLLGR
jgi:hypothetical protein